MHEGLVLHGERGTCLSKEQSETKKLLGDTGTLIVILLDANRKEKKKSVVPEAREVL